MYKLCFMDGNEYSSENKSSSENKYSSPFPETHNRADFKSHWRKDLIRIFAQLAGIV